MILGVGILGIMILGAGARGIIQDGPGLGAIDYEIGRASCRERV